MLFKRNLWAVSMMAALAAMTHMTHAQAQAMSSDEEALVVDKEADLDEAQEAASEDTVVVRDRADQNLTLFQHLSREDIAKRPTEDGNITDLLKSNENSVVNDLLTTELTPLLTKTVSFDLKSISLLSQRLSGGIIGAAGDGN